MGIAERKERERLQRRNDIIDAAEQVFFKYGFDTTPVERVAQEAELSKATVYLYFKSKEELYFSIFCRGQKIIFGMIDNAIKNIDGPIDLIKAFLKAIVQFQDNYPDYFDTLFYFQTHRFVYDLESEEIQRSRDLDRSYLQKWIGIINEGKLSGQIRRDLDPLSTAIVLWMQLTGFLKMYSVTQSELEEQYSINKEMLLETCQNLVLEAIVQK